jgi:hypothetical protein
VKVTVPRAIDHDIATGVWPDMTEHGWAHDDWPAMQADAGWIGEAGPGPSYLDPGSGGRRTTSPTATPPSRPGTSCTWPSC